MLVLQRTDPALLGNPSVVGLPASRPAELTAAAESGKGPAMGIRDLPTRRQPKLAFLDNALDPRRERHACARCHYL